MNSLELNYPSKTKKKDDFIGETLRQEILEHSKDFKTAWVSLGQALYTVWNDKKYHAWGYEKFEDYIVKEVGLKKELALKLLKTYYFIEQEEPGYLKKEFAEEREALQVPHLDAINVLRLAKQKKELLREDYVKLKKDIFDKGKEAGVVRKELTAIMKERKPVDPDEEREKRSTDALRRVLNALSAFKKDMETLKLLPSDVVEQTDKLIGRIKVHVP